MNAVVKHEPSSVVVRLAQRYGIDHERMLQTLRATAFKGEVSNEQMVALCVVADQYGLNPWTKEIYAFPDKYGGVVPVVGVDGWSRIINTNHQFDGMDFEDGPLAANKVPEWIECSIHRKDREHPISVREYFVEVYRQKPEKLSGAWAWDTHPRRMLRHKAMIQCARLAFGFVGIFDEDEASRIIDVTPEKPSRIDPRPDTSQVPDDKLEDAVKFISELLKSDKDEYAIAAQLREYEEVYLNPFPELYSKVFDVLKDRKIITKTKFKEYLRLMPPDDEKVPY